jgi:hypothetical protein
MFAVSHFIVSQVNFHVVPFLHKAHSPHLSSWYWKLFTLLDLDIRHRAISVSVLRGSRVRAGRTKRRLTSLL